MLGRHHALLRRIRTLRRDSARRREEGIYVAEGLHLAREALRHDVPVEIFVTSPALEAHPEGPVLLAEIASRGIRHETVADSVMQGLQDARSAQSILALVPCPQPDLARCLDDPAAAAFHVVAVGLQDPGNLGAILRTADAAGAAGVFVAGDSADLFHPRAVRASMGSVFGLPAMHTGIDDLLQALQERGRPSIGSDPGHGEPYTEASLQPPLALWVGAEGAGLDRALLDRLDSRVRIPMRHGVESLSVNAAVAVLGFEIARRINPTGDAG